MGATTNRLSKTIIERLSINRSILKTIQKAEDKIHTSSIKDAFKSIYNFICAIH